VTISAGVASFPQDGEDAAELLAAADERMFEAKREGRNRVVAGQEAVVAY
jgi:two-component system cell cycle response regulator